MLYSIWNIENRFDACYSIETNEKINIWDLIKTNDWSIFLVKDKKANWNKIDIQNFSNLWNLFSNQTILFQNFISSYWYSYYFKFYKLYVHDNKYIKKYPLPIIKREKKINIEWNYISEYTNFETFENYIKMWDNEIKTISYNDKFELSKYQNLFVFPDLWAINCFTQKIDFKYHIVNPTSTALSRWKDFLAIKNGKYKNIITTHSGVFQDWKKLETIYVFSPYKWYYKNQQNPRYFLPDLVKQIKFFYNVKNVYFVV